MNAMTGDEYRRSGRGGATPEPVSMDLPPDPFEDLAAPPLRLTPSVRRQVSATPEAAPDPVPQGFAAEQDDPADRPFELSASDPAAESWPGVVPSFDAAYAALAAEAEPAPAPRPAPPLMAPAAPPAPASRGLRQLRAAVAVGLLTAVTIVALAVAFRPASLDVAVEPEVPTALGSGPVPAPAATPAPQSTAVAAASVRLRVDSELSETRRAALEAAVDAAGYGGLEVAEVSSPIDRSRIEFFHPADQAAAEALARSLAPLTGGPVAVHDLSGVTLGAEPGRIDVWVSD